MDCGRVREKLSCYLDGVLDEATLEAIEEHLESCTGCKEELEALRSTLGLTAILQDVDPPAFLSSAIKDAVAKERETAGSCAYYLVMMSEYIDNELPAEDAAELESHIALCNTCANELAALRSTITSTAMLADVEPPAALRGKIAALTTGRKLVSPITVLRQSIAALFHIPQARLAGAALATVIVAVVIVFQSHKTEQKPIAKTVPVQKPVLAQVPETSTVVITPIPTKEDAVTTLRRAVRMPIIPSEKPKKTDVQPVNVHPSIAAVKIAKHEETAKHPDVPSNVASSTEVQDTVTVTAEKKDAVPSKSDESNKASPNDSKPQPTFMKLATLLKPASTDQSNYFSDIKTVARMKQQSDDKLRVDVISAKF
jgi:anti-sigma factor RsiW